MSDLPAPIRAFIDAYNDLDVQTMLGYVDDTILFRNLMNDEVTIECRGKMAFIDMAEASAGAFTERCQAVGQFITVETTTLLEFNFTGVVSRDLSNGWKAGQALSIPARSLYELEGDRIVRLIDQS